MKRSACLRISRGTTRRDLRLVAASVLATVAFASALVHVGDVGSVLNQARRSAVGPRAGLERCFDESNGVPGPRLRLRLPFINWVKQRLPRDAVYALAPYTGPPDAWCVALVLLPSLPAGPGGRARWTIAFGTIPPDLQGRIARHDPSVLVFAPGLALGRDSAQ
jgi:hypothetical protein